MDETLYSWTFKFHKVVRQQNSSAVEDFILSYSAVYLRIEKWMNYWNRSSFAKVIVKIKVARFLWPTVYIDNVVALLKVPELTPWTHGDITFTVDLGLQLWKQLKFVFYRRRVFPHGQISLLPLISCCLYKLLTGNWWRILWTVDQWRL